MSDTPKKPPARLQQHVVAHIDAEFGTKANPVFDDVLVFGTEIDALRFIRGKPDWLYAAVAHGDSVAEALKGIRT